MKVLKKVGIAILILLLLLIAVSFLLPNKLQVTKSLLLYSPSNIVFEQVNNLRNWEKWSPWHKLDTVMDIKYFGNEKGEGSGYEWESDNWKVGSGSLIIIASANEDSILAELEFSSSKKALCSFHFNPTDSGTIVTWGFEYKLSNNPFSKLMGIIMKRNIENDFISGLTNLNDYLKSMQFPIDVKIELTSMHPFDYIAIKDTVNLNEMSEKMGEYFGTLMEYSKLNNLIQINAPFTIYHSFVNDSAVIEVGIGISKSTKTKAPILCGKFNASNVVVADYYGPYNKISKAHELIQAWLVANTKKMNGPPYEFYVTDPSSEKDSTKWLTRVYYPVE